MRSKGYGSWFVCVSVFRRLFWHCRQRGGLLAIPAASELREPEKKGDFPETTAFERYAVKTSEKANMHNPLAYLELICLLRVPWRHKKLQQRAIDSRCQTFLAIPRMRSVPRVCECGLSCKPLEARQFALR